MYSKADLSPILRAETFRAKNSSFSVDICFEVEECFKKIPERLKNYSLNGNIQVSQIKDDVAVIEFKGHKFRDYTIIYHNFPNLFNICFGSNGYMLV